MLAFIYIHITDDLGTLLSGVISHAVDQANCDCSPFLFRFIMVLHLLFFQPKQTNCSLLFNFYICVVSWNCVVEAFFFI